MNESNLNNHPLDKYILDKINQKDIAYDPSGWQKVKFMLQSHKVSSNPKGQFSFPKLFSLKGIGAVSIVLILPFVIYHCLNYKTKVSVVTTIENTNHLKNPVNINLDTSRLRIETKQKFKNPNLELKMKQHNNPNNDFIQTPLNFDSTLLIKEKNLLLDSLQIHKAKDTIKSKKKHIFC
ncbi:MAG: hypothetical protein IPO48_01315 [Saprospiraceae bacterium]|nr:hypothetical protein [Saprospiraceae bacterium]